MRTTQVLVPLVAIVGLLIAAPSLWAMPAPVAMCCYDDWDCAGFAGACCDDILPGELPCSEEQPGYCAVLCVPPGR